MNAATPLLAAQRRKLMVGSFILALSALVTLLGGTVTGYLGVDAMPIKLFGLAVFAISLYWLAANVKCPACGLNLLWYAFVHAKDASWLDWLLHQTECPKCGYKQRSHAGSQPST